MKKIRQEDWQNRCEKRGGLRMEEERLDALTIGPLLPEGFCLEIFDCVDSTSTLLKERGPALRHGMAVAAEAQRAGRGTHGRSFASPAGRGIYLSVALQTDRDQLPLISSLCGVAVCEAIESCSALHPQIKWVNDLYIQNRKVCGILCESMVEPGQPLFVIAGIGVNVHPHAFDGELQNRAASLENFSTGPVDRSRLCAEILCRLDFWLHQSREVLLEAYRRRSLLAGRQVWLRLPDRQVRGLCRGIDEKGRLLLETEENGLEAFLAGDLLQWD